MYKINYMKKIVFTLVIFIPFLSFSQIDSTNDNELSQEYIEAPFSVKEDVEMIVEDVDILKNKNSKKEVDKNKLFVKPN